MRSFLLLLLAVGCAQAEPVEVLLKRGDALEARLEIKAALELFREAEKLAPKNREVLLHLSREYCLLMSDLPNRADKIRSGETALTYARQVLEQDPRNAAATLSIAVCYGRMAPLSDSKTKIAYSKMVKEYGERALALDPTNDLTYYLLGAWNFEIANLNLVTRTLAKVIYGSMPPASYAAAAEYFQKAIHLNPRRLGSHVELGRTYAALGRKSEARQELTAALQMPNRERDDPEAKRRATVALSGL